MISYTREEYELLSLWLHEVGWRAPKITQPTTVCNMNLTTARVYVLGKHHMRRNNPEAFMKTQLPAER